MPSKLIKEKLYDGKTKVKKAAAEEQAAAKPAAITKAAAPKTAAAPKAAAPVAEPRAAESAVPTQAQPRRAARAAAPREALASPGAATAAPAERAAESAKSGAALSGAYLSAMEKELERLSGSASELTEKKIDAETEAAVLDLRRAEKEAAAAYRDERARIAADEARALDNAALYASLRGDYGGVGQARYIGIMNAAEASRAKIGAEQRRLAERTAEEIAELHAKGGYEKAEALLRLAQERLEKLGELNKWAAEYELDEAELDAELEKWRAELELKRESLAAATEKALGGGADAEELFRAMRASGKPYTYLTANAARYGIYDSSPTVFEEIMREYRLWEAQ